MGTEIDFIGFADDCRVEGKVDLEDARLADFLNRNKAILVKDVMLVSTVDGHTKNFEELRGDPKRRLATKPSGVAMKLGPYSAEGFMHAPPTANPIRGLRTRPTMVALTDAVLQYESCGEPISEWYRTLLVNRELAISLRAVTAPSTVPIGPA
jgi:hypothetical protein